MSPIGRGSRGPSGRSLHTHGDAAQDATVSPFRWRIDQAPRLGDRVGERAGRLAANRCRGRPSAARLPGREEEVDVAAIRVEVHDSAAQHVGGVIAARD